MDPSRISQQYITVNNRYIIDRRLGIGSFGEIYVGIDRFLKKR